MANSTLKINFEFRNKLEENTFPNGSNLISISEVTPYPKIIGLNNGTEKIPLICLTLMGKDLYYSEFVQFGGRIISKEKMFELINYSNFPIKVKYGNYWYIVAKYFLAQLDEEGNPTIMFCGMVHTETRRLVDTRQIEIWINKSILSEASLANVRRLLSPFMDKTFEHDVVYSFGLEDQISVTPQFPKGLNLREILQFKKTVVQNTVDELF